MIKFIKNVAIMLLGFFVAIIFLFVIEKILDLISNGLFYDIFLTISAISLLIVMGYFIHKMLDDF